MSGAQANGRNPRVALYYAPPASSAWWREGCEWLGRDPEDGLETATPAHDVTHAPRRYGWHATIIPPFHMAPGVELAHVLACARAWASSVSRFEMPVKATELGRFVALRPAQASDDDTLRTLAAHALQTFAALRARPSRESIEQRIGGGMSERQIALLREWGYPYVFDEYRFHMTLSDSLDDRNARASIVSAWTRRIEALGPLPVHGAALFIEPGPGAPFTLWQRLPFNNAQDVA
ncbi:DUF1045 domain-containing protein [Caballeronia ptereochthonis]|jgi:hypothetical protein|uniref:Phosphonate metabolism protein n=1 Tax=Caballeronia ptereochthonis TaxID=1777144 RepID=A0A158EAH8_9BURK|nr:DUF1045 domain-containing protein [Caballeronia ptereochthonis]SAL03875.1 hypothetical protein AWB83_06905 [Caballeronia ptereochthonis]